jgi:hypothetical protein
MAEISLQMRGVIIALTLFNNDSFLEIEKKTGVKENTAWKIWNTLLERAGGSRDLHELLTVAALLPHPGRPPKVVDGTQESRALQQLAHDNPKL